MKALVTFLSLMAITLTASADPMGEKFKLACVLESGETLINKEARLSQMETSNGFMSVANLSASIAGSDVHMSSTGTQIFINTAYAGTTIAVQGHDSAILEVAKENSDGTKTRTYVECKLR